MLFRSGPGARLLLPGGEVGPQAEDVVGRPDELTHAGFLDTEFREELLRLVGGQVDEVALDLGTDHDGLAGEVLLDVLAHLQDIGVGVRRRQLRLLDIAGEDRGLVGQQPEGLGDGLLLRGERERDARLARVEVRLDPAVTAPQTNITRAAFKSLPGFTLLCETIEPLGLTFRVENVNPETAERAYFRLASAYKKDNLMEQALENCRALLSRYPNTSRRRETQTLMLDIYKGLKDYRSVMATLDELKRTATDPDEKRRIEAEIGSILFDMADYAKAAQAFKDSLQAARENDERLALREGFARALFRDGKTADALAQFEMLAKEEANPLRQFVAGMMVFALKFSLDQAFEIGRAHV